MNSELLMEGKAARTLLFLFFFHFKRTAPMLYSVLLNKNVSLLSLRSLDMWAFCQFFNDKLGERWLILGLVTCYYNYLLKNCTSFCYTCEKKHFVLIFFVLIFNWFLCNSLNVSSFYCFTSFWIVHLYGHCLMIFSLLQSGHLDAFRRILRQLMCFSFVSVE